MWALVVVALMASLFFVENEPAFFFPGIAFMAIASVAFEFAEVSYFAMLRQVSTPDTVGRVSGIGWSAGYFGGIFLLLICYAGFIAGDGGAFGLPTDDGMNVRVVAIVVAAWFLVFALPTFFRVPEVEPDATVDSGYADSYRRLFGELRQLWREDPQSIKFLVAQAVFRDGLAGVFTFGAILAVTVYGLSPSDVLLFVDGPGWFWPLGLVLCLFVGPAQSAARSHLARIAPEGREGQMFGLYVTTGRAVSWMAPAAPAPTPRAK